MVEGPGRAQGRKVDRAGEEEQHLPSLPEPTELTGVESFLGYTIPEGN